MNNSVSDSLPDLAPCGGSLLGLGDLYLPWTVTRHPLAAPAEQAACELALQFGLLRNNEFELRRFHGFVTCASYVYLNSTLEQLTACNDTLVGLWFLDNTYDDEFKIARDTTAVRQAMEYQLAVLKGSLPDAPAPLARFMADLRSRLLRLSPSGDRWLQRLLTSLEEYWFRGSLPATENWKNNRVPPLAEYLVQREYDSAMYPCIDLLELEAGSVPDGLYTAPAIVRMRQLCNYHVAFTNDIMSYEKEVLQRDNPNNLVRVLMTHRGLTREAAVSEIVAMLNTDVREFCELAQQVPELVKGDAALGVIMERYVTGMQCWMRGNYDWSLNTGRYCSASSPFPELRKDIY